ncbi:hypothetical protein F4808DRAFT_411281 [Astrocystis sublimbata]|nr:hypothetical protein F4808DRAFT_411281 [Astrocystis sublimbata]
MSKYNQDIEWIDLSNAPRGTSETRSRVRSHAMKKTAAARRASTGWGKVNTRQLPEFSITQTFGQTGSHVRPRAQRPAVTYNEIIPPASMNTLSTFHLGHPVDNRLFRPMSLTGVELLASEVGINILDLSALTEIQCGWTACAVLVSRGDYINGLVGPSRRRSTYLHSVASRYGSSPCLDAALRCVAVRARKVLGPPAQDCDERESLQYVAALQLLQKSMDHVEERKQPEVLAAINLLSLFELLRYTREQAWSLHICGAARWIRARGPGSFGSDFDMRLVLSLVSAITHESMRRNEACFLAEASWQQMLRSSILPSEAFSTRSHLAVSLCCIMVQTPGLLKDVSAVINKPRLASSHSLRRCFRRVRDFRRDLLSWRLQYDSATLIFPAPNVREPESDDVRVELLGSFYSLMISCSRLMGALNVNVIHIFEDEAVTLANEMIKLEDNLSSTNRSASFYIGQKLIVARSALETTGIWRDASHHQAGTTEPSKFNAWVSALLSPQM